MEPRATGSPAHARPMCRKSRINDATALTAAFTGAEGVFVLIPPIFDPTPGYPEVRAIVAALKEALEAARPAKVVSLSTIGA
jgi:uncharacterized protein YbjT (DUF2867 family)